MSVEMEMNLEGLQELRDKLNRLDDGMKRNVQDAMEFEAEAMKNTARAGCPVKTGRLRDSIFTKVENWMVTLGATAAYAVYQEFGTRPIQPRRFLSNAVEAHMQNLINRISQALGQAIGEASTR
jgi:HK97 gp10 family phage protein